MSARSTSQSVSGSVRGSVKLAGEEAKDRMYEPKHKKKAVRVLTVIAYVFSVSLAAIMLSMYYIFIWQGTKPNTQPADHHHTLECRPGAGGLSHGQMVNLPQLPSSYNESQMAETPRVLPAKEELLPTTPLSKLAHDYLQMQQEKNNFTLPVSVHD